MADALTLPTAAVHALEYAFRKLRDCDVELESVTVGGIDLFEEDLERAKLACDTMCVCAFAWPIWQPETSD